MNRQLYMNIGNNENHKMVNELHCIIDYNKYLQCSKCEESKLYCDIHKIEVDKILNQCYKKKHA